MKKRVIKKPKKKTQSQLKKELDSVFSRWIRNRDSVNGYVTCACCRQIIPIEQSQNMHYISRSYLVHRFNERNCHAGCRVCNVFKNGNYPAYTIFMLDKYGEQYIRELEQTKGTICKYLDYEQLIEKYK